MTTDVRLVTKNMGERKGFSEKRLIGRLCSLSRKQKIRNVTAEVSPTWKTVKDDRYNCHELRLKVRVSQ